MTETAKEVSNREIKSSAFTTYFSEPENAAKLYSALEGEEVSPEDIHFTTLEGVLFVARKNDLSFTARNRVLVISEHQSTVNLNMPLRSIIYYGRTMEKLLSPKAIYRRKRIMIPTPEFFVFYNGNEIMPEEECLQLSDSYIDKIDSPMLELTVRVININLPVNHAILEKCRPLYEYSWFIHQIKGYLAEGMGRDDAVIRAVEDCERMGIMADFVKKHGSEVRNMLNMQFNWEDAKDAWYEEGVEDGVMRGKAEGKKEGKAEGKAEAILQILSLYGDVSEKLKQRVLAEQDMATLDRWLQTSVKCGSIEGFMEQVRDKEIAPKRGMLHKGPGYDYEEA